MRIAILSDVHANLAALEAVLAHAGAGGALDAVWCLGDTVGYGPQPSQCIARLRQVEATLVAGNHDRAATGAIGVDEFNADAATAALWTRGQLGADDAGYLDSLPEVAAISEPDAEFTLVHGTLRSPLWEYLYSHEAARAHLDLQKTPFSLVGHTHVPLLVVDGEDGPQGCELYALGDGDRVELSGERRLVINPGGVGQPRDGDPRSAYALYDTAPATVTVHRVEYDIAATQKLMAEAGLPRWLIERLSLGR
ncbi:MAG: metallophosphoesterase family protein [Dehalococcoidia bacterium]